MRSEEIVEPRSFDRNSGRITAIVVSAATVAVVVTALGFRKYVGDGCALFSVFAFPFPVTVGLAAYALAPRGIVVPAVWASIVAGVAATILAGVMDRTAVAAFVMPGVGIVCAAAIAGLSSVAARQAAQRGCFRAWSVVILAAAGVTALVGYGLASHRLTVFECEVLPAVVLKIDGDYLAVPESAAWQCLRCNGRYELRCRVHGRPLTAIVDPESGDVVGVVYDLPGCGARLSTDDSAQVHLEGLGVRRRMLSSLSRVPGSPPKWIAGLDSTCLTLSADGGVRFRPLQARP